MNLPFDYFRCAGELRMKDGSAMQICPLRDKCARHLQIARDRENKNINRPLPCAEHCYVGTSPTQYIPEKREAMKA